VSHHPTERLGPYLEGELGSEDRRAIELHLARCEACSLALRELRTTVELLRLVPEPLAPAQLGRAVMDRIAAGERRPLARWRARLSSAPPIPSALGAVGAAALVILTVRAVIPFGAPWAGGSSAPGPLPGSALVAESSEAAGEPVALLSTPPLRAASLRPSATRTLPAPFRPRAKRSGGMGVGAAVPGSLEMLPPRPTLARCQAFGTRADVEGDSPGLECRPWFFGMPDR
jgi:hypothetical protein